MRFEIITRRIDCASEKSEGHVEQSSRPARTAEGGTVVAGPQITARTDGADRPRRIDRPRNTRPGTSDWQLTYVRPEKTPRFARSSSKDIASHPSVRRGETIAFHLSADPVCPCDNRHLPQGY